MPHGCWMPLLLVALAGCARPKSDASRPSDSPHEVQVPPPAASGGAELEMTDLGPITAADAGAAPSGDACHGAAPPGLTTAVQARAADVKKCYERALRDDPRLAGRLVVSLEILEDGSVRKFQLKEDEIGNAGMRDCVEQSFTRPLAVHPESCIAVVVPFRFVPKPKTDAGP